jgi:hypothetical protein
MRIPSTHALDCKAKHLAGLMKKLRRDTKLAVFAAINLVASTRKKLEKSSLCQAKCEEKNLITRFFITLVCKHIRVVRLTGKCRGKLYNCTTEPPQCTHIACAILQQKLKVFNYANKETLNSILIG